MICSTLHENILPNSGTVSMYVPAFGKGTCHLRFSGIPPLRGFPPPPTPLTENQSEKKKVFFLNGKSAKLFPEIFS